MFTFLDTGRSLLTASAARRLGRAILLAGVTLPLAIVVPNRLGRNDSELSSPDAPLAFVSGNARLDRALAAMRYGLKPADLAQYRALFAAVDKADWRSIDQSAARIEDRRLIGHILAARYLSSGIQPAFADLRSWMDLYGDLPEADDIYQLAQSGQLAEVGQARPVSALPLPRSGQASANTARDPDAIGASEPKTSAGDRASTRFFAADDKGALADAAHAIEQLRERASTSLWIAGLAAWRLGRFSEAAHHFTALAGSQTASGWMLAAGAYWAGRVEEHNGVATAAAKWFSQASRYPTTFYGMLAIRKLGLDLAQEISAASLTADHLDNLAETPAGYRAIALLQLGRLDLAAQELERIDPAGNPKIEEALIVVSDAAHLGEISANLAQRIARPADDATAHFPIPAWKPRGGFRVDPALVYAVARQESRFDPHAVSPAGAAGLMQIMPGTAQAIGGQESGEWLFDPSTNLDVGQRYLSALMKDPNIGENLLMLAVAYNSGSGNPAKLRTISAHDDPLLAIESIPISETRGFIEHVLANYWIYRARLGGNTESLTDLADGRWPIYDWGKTPLDKTLGKFDSASFLPIP